jgi:hypothetical protein
MARRGGKTYTNKAKKNYSTTTKSSNNTSSKPSNVSSPNSNNSSRSGFFTNMASTALGVGGAILLTKAILNSGDTQNGLMKDGDSNNKIIPCQINFEVFGNCLGDNKTNIGNCQWAYDDLMNCQIQQDI